MHYNCCVGSIFMDNYTHENYTNVGACLVHKSQKFRIRKRNRNRCWEVEIFAIKGIWKSTYEKELDNVEKAVMNMMANDGMEFKSEKKMTLGEFAEGFFLREDVHSIRRHNDKMNKQYEDIWYEANQGRLNNYILPKFGNYPIDSITDIMIEDWYISLTSYADSSKELADNTKVKVLNTFKIVMKEAKRRRVIEDNPCDTVEVLIQNSKKRGYFTIDEIRLLFPKNRLRLMHIWGSLQWALFFSIMVDTGWRCGEVSALRKQNFIDGGVYTTSSVDYTTGRIKNSIKTTKKGQAYKVGILSDYTLSLLKDFVSTWERDELFYLEDKGHFNMPGNSNYALKRALDYVGIDCNGRTEHCIRHSFDTYMLNNTGDVVSHEDVLELMAHTSYRPEYDHRTEADMISRLSKAKPILNDIRKAK